MGKRIKLQSYKAEQQAHLCGIQTWTRYTLNEPYKIGKNQMRGTEHAHVAHVPRARNPAHHASRAAICSEEPARRRVLGWQLLPSAGAAAVCMLLQVAPGTSSRSCSDLGGSTRTRAPCTATISQGCPAAGTAT